MATSQDPLIQQGTQAGNQILQPQSSGTITPEMLQPGQSVQVPTYTPTAPSASSFTPTANTSTTSTPTSTSSTPTTTSSPAASTPTDSASSAAINSANATSDQIIASTTPAETDTQKQADQLVKNISDTVPLLAGQTQALNDAENAAGVPQLKSQLNDINSQINTKQAELNQDDATLLALNHGLETTPGITLFDVSRGEQKNNADAAIIRAQKVAEIGVLNARALAVQGNISLAVDTAQKAVDAKYAPIQDQINTYKAQLDAIQPLLTRDEQKQANEQSIRVSEAQKAVDDQKAQEKDNLSLALTAGVNTQFVNNNGTFFNASTGQAYSTPQEFFKASGVSSFADAYAKGLVTDITPQKIQDIQFAQQAQAKYPDVRIPANATPEQVARIVQSSRIYQKETYIAPTDNTNAQTAAALQQTISGLQDYWKQKGYIQGNGTISATDYRTAKNKFVASFAGIIPDPGTYFDNAMSGFIDTSGKNYKANYSIK